jgi:hypothetical protein
VGVLKSSRIKRDIAGETGTAAKSNALTPLPVQVVAVIAELVSHRPEHTIVVVIEAICERLAQFMNGVKISW